MNLLQVLVRCYEKVAQTFDSDAPANFSFWLCVDGPVLARDIVMSMQVGRVQLCVRPVCAVR